MIGRLLKHYQVEELIGEGGMGVVYRACDIQLQRSVALKVLSPELIADPGRKKRFLVEARAAAAVSHPAIAQIYEIDEADGTAFIAMEFVDGRTVGRLVREGEIDLLGAVEIGLQVAEGLAKAHEARIIHRDIKSDNIMVTRDGHAKLLDFGLAKLMETGSEDSLGPQTLSRTLTLEQAHTLAGAVLGTLNYMSPEQARGRVLDHRSDIFSLGVVLYEMVSGELPFKGDSPLDTMHAIAFEEAKPVTALRRNLPLQIHQIISRCLRKRPEDRYPDAREMAADLKRLKSDLETGMRFSLTPAQRVRNWMESAKTLIPFGTKGIILASAILVVAIVLFFTRIQWGSLVGPAFLAFFGYRIVRNRKRRLIKDLTKKISALPEVLAVLAREDQLTVVLDKAPARTYIRISSLVDSANAKLFFGKPLAVQIKDGLSDEETQRLVRQPGVLYIREDGEN